MYLLDIIIPSYNRPQKLLNMLKKLYPQLVSNVIIKIIDNCSDVNYESYCTNLDPQIENYITGGQIVFFRNRYNIGLSANLMRAFETCDAEWMWLLSDDDDVSQDAISDILDQIELLKEERDVVFIKFSSKGCEATKGGYFIKSLEHMINTLALSKTYFNSFIFISNGVYRVPYLKKHIEIGYQYLNTYVPHLIMLLYFLSVYKTANLVFFSDKKVASYVVPEKGYSYGFVAGLGVGAFKNFPFNINKEQYLKLEGVFAPHNDYKVAIDLFYFARFRSNMYVARKLFKNYYVQIKSGRSLLKRMAMRSVYLLFFVPNFFDRIIVWSAMLSSTLNKHIKEIKIRNQIS